MKWSTSKFKIEIEELHHEKLGKETPNKDPEQTKFLKVDMNVFEIEKYEESLSNGFLI